MQKSTVLESVTYENSVGRILANKLTLNNIFNVILTLN